MSRPEGVLRTCGDMGSASMPMFMPVSVSMERDTISGLASEK